MFKFVFDFVLDRPDKTTVRLLTQDVQCVSPTKKQGSDNLCPYPIPSIKEIIKLIDSASAMYDKDRFISDLFCCMAVSISNLVDLYHKDEREEIYKQTITRYAKTEQQTIADICGKLFMLLSSVVYDDGAFDDYLGELFMGCFMGNKHMGQFFTPYHISKLCAKLSIGTPNKSDNKILTLNDPCCGSGGMVIAAMDILKNDFDINYAMDCFVDCSDIDLRCVHMTYLQLSLAGVPAIVKHQDALTRKLYSVWRTPAFVFQYPRFMKYAN